jgi:hypothetical protein
MAIPKRRYSTCPVAVSIESSERMCCYSFGISTHDYVSTHLNCYGPLRILSQRQTWDTEYGGLFLDAAGIGEYEARVTVETKEIEVS